MNSKSSVSLQFQRPDGRAEFERVRRDVKASLGEKSVDEATAELLELGVALDMGVARAKRNLLGSALCWNDENQALTTWIHQQHRAVFEMGQRMVQAMRRDARNPLLPRLVALALFHWGEAVKWTAWRERDEYEPLHDLYRLSVSSLFLDAKISWMADGRGQCVTIESLYLRALLLDRFASGRLTRPQVEILDAWLWQWIDDLKGERTFPGGAVLRVDMDTNAGLREGNREGDGPTVYLRLDGLEKRRSEIVRELHRGRITPPHGCVSELRIEEHMAVLDHLQCAFRMAPGEAPQRAPREQEAGTRMEVWVGLSDVLARGVGVGTETGRYRAMQLSGAAVESEARRRFSDASRRYLWLADSSATGCGFEALESDAAGIEVGDLLGWRKSPGGALALGHVMRRMPSATSGQVFIGVKTLTEAAQPLPLKQVVTFDNGSADGTYLFVPGNDDSGRRDSFVMSEATFELQASYHAHVGSDMFMLKLNRVRAKGRGWILAGFEILPAKGLDPIGDGDIPRLESLDFVLEPAGNAVQHDEDRVTHAFERELSSRLLA